MQKSKKDSGQFMLRLFILVLFIAVMGAALWFTGAYDKIRTAFDKKVTITENNSAAAGSGASK